MENFVFLKSVKGSNRSKPVVSWSRSKIWNYCSYLGEKIRFSANEIVWFHTKNWLSFSLDNKLFLCKLTVEPNGIRRWIRTLMSLLMKSIKPLLRLCHVLYIRLRRRTCCHILLKNISDLKIIEQMKISRIYIFVFGSRCQEEYSSPKLIKALF